MAWEIKTRGSNEAFESLDHHEVLSRLASGLLTLEDWGRTRFSQPWRQLGEFADFAGFRTRRRRLAATPDDDVAMDMTPMIDVTFLLLIFFMITATFHLQKGLDFPPQQTQDERASRQPAPGLVQFADRIILTIDQNDKFAMRDASAAANAPGKDIDPKDLVRVLKEVSQDEKKSRVFILAHDLTSHEAVVKAIDSAAQAGIPDVAIGDVTTNTTPASGGARNTSPRSP
ncbi:MAG: biopolymer transporter ExbD [Planctomycetaceae bacterium]